MVRNRLRSMPRIFLSYSHKDRVFGVQLVSFLRNTIGNDDAVWYDNGLHGGEVWWDEIVKQLHNRNAFIVILSPDAVRSPYVKEEMRIALQRHLEGKMLFIPLLLRKCRPPRTLRTRQVLSFLSTDEHEASLKKVFEALGLSSDIDSSAFLNTDPVKTVSSPQIDTANTPSKKQDQLPSIEVKNVEKMFELVKDAFETQNWDYVIAVTGALMKLYPESLPSSIYYMRGRAYLYTETTYDDQYSCAEEALEYALDRVQDTALRIELLDAYALCLVQQNKNKELESCIDQALQLSPDDPVWRLLQKEIIIENTNKDKSQFQILNMQTNGCSNTLETEIRQINVLSGNVKEENEEKPTIKGKSVRRLSELTLLMVIPFLIASIARRILKK